MHPSSWWTHLLTTAMYIILLIGTIYMMKYRESEVWSRSVRVLDRFTFMFSCIKTVNNQRNDPSSSQSEQSPVQLLLLQRLGPCAQTHWGPTCIERVTMPVEYLNAFQYLCCQIHPHFRESGQLWSVLSAIAAVCVYTFSGVLRWRQLTWLSGAVLSVPWLLIWYVNERSVWWCDSQKRHHFDVVVGASRTAVSVSYGSTPELHVFLFCNFYCP